MASEAETKAILAAHESELTRLPNVVGVGIVSAGKSPDDTAIAVYVDVKRSITDLRTEDIVPRWLASRIGGQQIEAPTRVIEVGKITF